MKNYNAKKQNKNSTPTRDLHISCFRPTYHRHSTDSTPPGFQACATVYSFC